jgi:hypothetical protein
VFKVAIQFFESKGVVVAKKTPEQDPIRLFLTKILEANKIIFLSKHHLHIAMSVYDIVQKSI